MIAGNQVKWRAVAGLRSALTALFILVAGASVALSLAHVHRKSVLGRIADNTATLQEARHADDLVHSAGQVLLILVAVTGIVFLVWQWRSARNAEALDRFGARFGPVWSIGGWFIPLANLVIPVLVMQDLWRSFDPRPSIEGFRKNPRSGLIGWWWGVFVISGFLSRGGTASSSSLSDLRSAEDAASFGAALFAVAAILAIAVVSGISTRQLALRAAVAEQASGSSAAAAASVRCASCGAEYISGTALCPECMGTEFQPTGEN